MTIRIIAFDCFGTVFKADKIPRDEIDAYSHHMHTQANKPISEFEPFEFPETWKDLDVRPDAAEGIAALTAEGYVCVALSNGSKDLIDALSERHGIAWHTVIDLEKHRVYKPHPCAYKTVEYETGYLPCETLMVTANPTFGDLEQSRRLGMEAITIRHGYPDTIIELAEYLNKRKPSTM